MKIAITITGGTPNDCERIDLLKRLCELATTATPHQTNDVKSIEISVGDIVGTATVTK